MLYPLLHQLGNGQVFWVDKVRHVTEAGVVTRQETTMSKRLASNPRQLT
jgi:hypothetical protein